MSACNISQTILISFSIEFTHNSPNKDNFVDLKSSAMNYSNATVISDKWEDGTQWNIDISGYPDITVDEWGNIHVVWEDLTPGPWKQNLNDYEIMYANFSASTGEWSNATVISDGYNNEWGWNTGQSNNPDIAVDGSNNIHVVWTDQTDGVWGVGSYIDSEIMYVNYTIGKGWSNATVISDKWDDGSEWNTGSSTNSKIAIDDSNNIQVVWQDGTDGVWGDDIEIMYVNYTIGKGWSNATVISDGYNGEWGWNDQNSFYPDIAMEGSNIHVVWHDDTDGVWGDDSEIMYANYNSSIGQWSNATVISDKWEDGTEWNIDTSERSAIVVSGVDIHVIWEDYTSGPWGDDIEIMYTKFSADTGQWSNATVISDKWEDGTEWNTGDSSAPSIAVDGLSNLHVVWYDTTPEIWGSGGSDSEIMYSNFLIDMAEWSNASVISDKWEDGTEWNILESQTPDIIADTSGNLHVVWHDGTSGPWGSGKFTDDWEIMYTMVTIDRGVGFTSGNGDDDDEDDKDNENLLLLAISLGAIFGIIAFVAIIYFLKKKR